MHRRKPRFDDDEPRDLKYRPRHVEYDCSDDGTPEVGDRWSTWDISTAGERGPEPYPDWLITELAAKVDALIRPYVAATRDDAPRGSALVHLGLQAFAREVAR